MLNNEYYVWGAGTFGGRIIEFMKNELAFKAVIDNNPAKQGTVFHGLPVISYTKAKPHIPEAKIVVAIVDPIKVRNFLMAEGLTQNSDFYLMYDFVPRYYWEKKLLVPMVVNPVTTTMCNMKCKGCQTYIHMASNSRHMSMADSKRNIDLMYSHIDISMSINFCCGESLLDSDLPKVCSYIHDNYADRYYTMAVQTNGTIIPEDDVMEQFSKSNAVFSISDYPENKKSVDTLTEKCDVFGIPWYLNRLSDRENWYDFGDPHTILEKEPGKLQQKHKECWIPGIGIYDGWMYLCTVQAWSHAVAEAGTRETGDAFDLRQPKSEASREELYKIISRQSELGYVSHCMRCNGTIPILKQT